MFKVYDQNNKAINCEIIFTFQKNLKNFIVYRDDEGDILASYYTPVGEKAIISPINDETDFDLVDKEIEKRMSYYE